MRGPDTQVIASAGFPAEAERQRHVPLPFRYLTGTGASPAFDVQPDRLISERTSLVVGDTEFVLIPVRGGETPDALMVHLPASGLLFTGDVMMPYLGIPFTAEGSPEGLLDTLRYIRELAPRQLIQGHTTLTENFTIEALTGLEPALTELHEFALARIGENMPLPHILDVGYLPALLRDHPAAVVPYLVTRDDFIARLYHQRTGYWQPDGQGLDPRSAGRNSGGSRPARRGKGGRIRHRRGHPGRPGRPGPRPGNNHPGPAPASRQQRARRAPASSCDPADGAAPAVGSVRLRGLRRTGRR